MGHSLFWLLMIAISFSTDLTTNLDIEESFFRQALFYGMPINMLVFYLNYQLLVPRYMSGNVRLYIVSVIALIVLSALTECLIDGLFLSFLDIPFTPNTLYALCLISLVIHSIYWILSMLARLGFDWFSNIKVQRKIKEQHTQTELALLKSQVHPHFLFNMLNTLYSSSYEYGDHQTADGIGKLSHLLRYMLYETKEKTVPLENELDYLQNYIDLQKLRFIDDVAISFTIDGEPDNLDVAPMMFITLVENAFKHGISPAKQSAIKVAVTITDDQMVLLVENDIHRERAKTELEGNAGGLGLDNLQRRLTLLYPQQHCLTMQQQNGRYIATLELSY